MRISDVQTVHILDINDDTFLRGFSGFFHFGQKTLEWSTIISGKFSFDGFENPEVYEGILHSCHFPHFLHFLRGFNQKTRSWRGTLRLVVRG